MQKQGLMLLVGFLVSIMVIIPMLASTGLADGRTPILQVSKSYISPGDKISVTIDGTGSNYEENYDIYFDLSYQGRRYYLDASNHWIEAMPETAPVYALNEDISIYQSVIFDNLSTKGIPLGDYIFTVKLLPTGSSPLQSGIEEHATVTVQAANKVALLLPLSGAFEQEGKSIKQAIQLALAKKVDSDQIKLVIQDTKSSVDEMKKLFPEVWQDYSVMAIVTANSPETEAATQNPDRRDMLVISPSASSSILLEVPNLLLIAPTNDLEGASIYNVMQNAGIKRYAVLFEPNIYSMDLFSQLFGEGILQLGGEHPTLAGAMPVFNETVPVNAVTGLESLDAIVYLGYSDGFLNALEEFQKAGQGQGLKWFAGDAELASKVSEAESTQSEDITVLGFGTDETASKPFEGDYSDMFGEVPSIWAHYGYDTGCFLNKVLETILDAHQYLTREKVLETAKGIQYEGITGEKGFALEGTSATGCFDIFRIQDHKWEKTGTTKKIEE